MRSSWQKAQGRETALLAGGLGLLTALGVGYLIYRRRRRFPRGVAKEDARFVSDAARRHADLMVTARPVGVEAYRADVRAFAQRLVDEHERALQDLADIAAYLGITPDTKPSRSASKRAENLLVHQGAHLDREFLDATIEELSEALEAFRGFAEYGRQPEVRTIARARAAMLEAQLDAARSLRGVPSSEMTT